MNYIELQPKIPENIALSFSGGGFRAASYTLGCLAYMESINIGEKKFTDLVNFISSASGGTITSLIYTSAQRKGVSFKDFYVSMHEKMLNGSGVLERVFEILDDNKIWKDRPDKARNIINAFSVAYDEIFFDKEVFGIYWNDAAGVVKEVCANSTEFDNAMLFRFQNAGEIGNKFLHFKGDALSVEKMKQIKLADILACSSCFTVGFEPFMFPGDFTYAALTKDDLQNSIKQDRTFNPVADNAEDDKHVSFGLMDGGIDDNQGIDSFIRAEERLQTKNKFGYDLFISCDVSSNYTSGYNFPKENEKNVFQKLSLLQYVIVIILMLGTSIAGVLTSTYRALSYSFIGISSVLLLLAIILTIKGFAAYNKSVDKKNTYGLIIFRHIYFFLKIRLSVLLQIIDSRATSAGYLAAVVFLKKIRRISYDRLFEKVSERKLKADGNELQKGEDEKLAITMEVKHWKRFSLQNAIYLLTPKNSAQRIKDISSEKWYKLNPQVVINNKTVDLITLLSPSAALQPVAEIATEMDTTLWYDENQIANNQPAALIAAGQFTTCYNLLRYAFRFDANDPVWMEFQTKLVADWNKFNNVSPYWMYNDLGKHIKDFKPL
ncbi:MAG: patatin-like phospholipase family protein [Ginsengibacter sp.]